MPRTTSLSYELLETFIRVVEADGDAAVAARQLNINQPSMSKRLAVLQRPGLLPQPWLFRQGKTWKLTPEGERVRPAVQEMIRRYEQLKQSLTVGATDLPDVSLACGQEAIKDIVLSAVKQFRKAHPHGRLCIATPSGRDRIQGVATGVYDLALVTEDPQERAATGSELSERLQAIARQSLYVEPLLEDRFVLVATARLPKEESKAAWHRRFLELPAQKPVRATALAGLPLLLPERGRSRREQFDRWARQADVTVLDVAVELGGWEAILTYASEGLGVGLATERSARRFLQGHGRLEVRTLSETEFPPDAVRLITRKAHGADRPLLTPSAETFWNITISPGISD